GPGAGEYHATECALATPLTNLGGELMLASVFSPELGYAAKFNFAEYTVPRSGRRTGAHRAASPSNTASLSASFLPRRHNTCAGSYPGCTGAMERERRRHRHVHRQEERGGRAADSSRTGLERCP